ncbi:MAG: Fic family protein [Pseudomonadota bacterium]
MHSFKPQFLSKIQIPPHISWLIGTCMESRGKEKYWFNLKPEMLKTLTELAIIQSTESSNRIEGILTDSSRLKPLLSGDVKPNNRPEEEILGYKKALKWIHESFDQIKINSSCILKLHEICQQGELCSDAGKFKEKDNEIIEIFENGERYVRFTPIAASLTSKYIEQLCLAYQDLMDKKVLPELLVISSFVFDFLCIHPFRDGNGRVSRLMKLLLLYQNGYRVGKYISIERIIEETKINYYATLKESSKNWHDAKHDIWVWHKYFLETLKEAYREFNDSLEKITHIHKNKSELIRQAILNEPGEFSLARISNKVPSVSAAMIKKVLIIMKEEGLLELKGLGRGAKWRVKH